MKYNFSKNGTDLVITLDTENGKYSPEINILNDPNITLENSNIWIYENGKFLRYLLFNQIGTIDGVIPTSSEDVFTKLKAIISTLSIVNINKKVEKYTLEASLPTIGSLLSIYFLTVDGIKYLKYWDGTAYVNASDKITLPNMVPDFYRDYYAKKSDVNITNYSGFCRNIAVIEDEDNSNSLTHYFYNGSELQWIVSVNQ